MTDSLRLKKVSLLIACREWQLLVVIRIPLSSMSAREGQEVGSPFSRGGESRAFVSGGVFQQWMCGNLFCSVVGVVACHTDEEGEVDGRSLVAAETRISGGILSGSKRSCQLTAWGTFG